MVEDLESDMHRRQPISLDIYSMYGQYLFDKQIAAYYIVQIGICDGLDVDCNDYIYCPFFQQKEERVCNQYRHRL
jgi:Fe-S-cluster containining protein